MRKAGYGDAASPDGRPVLAADEDEPATGLDFPFHYAFRDRGARRGRARTVKNFHWPVRVYYEDTDAGGVVYYANYLKFFERARSERLRAMGFEQDTLMRREGVVFVVRRVEIDYFKPARFNDALTVSADFGPIKHASLTFHQSIARDDSGRCCTLCEAKVQIVCVDCDTLRPRPIPETLLRRINDDF